MSISARQIFDFLCLHQMSSVNAKEEKTMKIFPGPLLLVLRQNPYIGIQECFTLTNPKYRFLAFVVLKTHANKVQLILKPKLKRQDGD